MTTPTIARAMRSAAPGFIRTARSVIQPTATIAPVATQSLQRATVRPLPSLFHAPSPASQSPSLFQSLLALSEQPAAPTLGHFEPAAVNANTDAESVVDCPTTTDTVLIVPLWCHLTYNPNVLKRKRTHGYLARMTKKTGRRVIKRRLAKGRKLLST